MFLAIDANFRLKLKSRNIRDPELAPGSLYFVDVVKFQEHLKNHVDEGEVSPEPFQCRWFDNGDRSKRVGLNSMLSIKRTQGQ